MANYEEPRVKLTNNQYKKLNSAVKRKTGIALRITTKNFQDEESSYELFLTTRQITICQWIQSLVKRNCLKSFNQVSFLVLCWAQLLVC